MNPIIKTVLFSGLLILTINGCVKDKIMGTFYLTEEMKNGNPYINGNTVTFIDSMGKELVCEVERENTIEKHLYSVNSNSYYLWEKETTNIQADSLNLRLTMAYEPHREPLLDIYARYKGNSVTMSQYELPINYSTTPRLPSIQVNGVWYYQVYYFENNYNQNLKIYYSTTYGILKVEFENGQFLDFVSPEPS